jgi:hypothetical protein
MSVDVNGNATSGTADPVELLVGDGKKYKTVADLAKSRLEADSFIEQLKGENAALREVVKAKEKTSRTDDFDAFLAELKGNALPKADATASTTDNQGAKGVSMADVENLLKQKETERMRDTAYAAVRAKVAELLGSDKADEGLAKAMQSTGLQEGDVKNLAFRSPEVALRALGFTELKPQSGINSSVGSEAFFGSKTDVRNWEYYKGLRGKMSESEFWNPKIQKQLMKDRTELGDQFWKQ